GSLDEEKGNGDASPKRFAFSSKGIRQRIQHHLGETSPVKEFLQQRFGRRSSSFDNSQYEGSWSRFQEWKGKLAGTVEGKLGEHLKHITSLKRLSEKTEPEAGTEQEGMRKGGKECSDDEEGFEKVGNEPHSRKGLLDVNLPSPDESYETLKSFTSTPSTNSETGIFEDAQEFAMLGKELGPLTKWEKLQSYFSIAPGQSRRKLIFGGCILAFVLGWMLETDAKHKYNQETFEMAQLRPIYMTLEGTLLCISNTGAQIPMRAMHNEEPIKAKFSFHRVYDLKGSQVMLLPENLARKRLWSKKFPIHIRLAKKCLLKENVKMGKENVSLLAKALNVTTSLDSEEHIINPPVSLGSSLRAIVEEQPLQEASKTPDPSHTSLGAEGPWNESESNSESEEEDEENQTRRALTKKKKRPSESWRNLHSSTRKDLLIFARTAREKEDWFRHLTAGSKDVAMEVSIPSFDSTQQQFFQRLAGSLGIPVDSLSPPRPGKTLSFDLYMERVLPQHKDNDPTKPLTEINRQPRSMMKELDFETLDPLDRASDLQWLNAFVARLFFDFLCDCTYAAKVKDRLQQKLSRLRLPSVVEGLTITELDLGSQVPMIHRASLPWSNERGFWVALDLSYDGGFRMTLEGKINLRKILDEESDATVACEDSQLDSLTTTSQRKRSPPKQQSLCVFFLTSSSSGVDYMSPESSPEVTTPQLPNESDRHMNRLIQKIRAFPIMDSVKKSQYVQWGVDKLAKTPLILQVELHKILGTLHVNVPLPPCDRLWWGFASRPQVVLTAIPKVGERILTITQIVELIEKKLVEQLEDRLKQFFSKLSKGGGLSRPFQETFHVTPHVLESISASSQRPLGERLKNIRELSENVALRRIEENGIEAIWKEVKDLLAGEYNQEARHTCWELLHSLVSGQSERLTGPMRAIFFSVVATHMDPEDVEPRLELLKVLTENGKDFRYFEENVGSLFLHLLPEIQDHAADRISDFLELLSNVIKFNTAYIDSEIIAGFVNSMCLICGRMSKTQEGEASLLVLEAVLCYSYLPSEALPSFITTLCRLANNPHFCASAWKLMRKLLGTNMGHSAVYTMCAMLQSPSHLADIYLLRGAIFFLSMSLWGTQQALNANHPLVNFEVTLTLTRLIKKYGKEQNHVAWSLILDIIEKILAQLTARNVNEVADALDKLICTIEDLECQGKFGESPDRLYDLIESASLKRREESVLHLLEYRKRTIQPVTIDWLPKLISMVDKYYVQETRPAIRLHMLSILKDVVRMNSPLYEEELLEKIVLPSLENLELEPDIDVREQATEFLVQLALTCQSKKCFEILDILEQVIKHPFEMRSEKAGDTVHIVHENEVRDVQSAIVGLTKIFKSKMYALPSTHAIRAYKLLVSHLIAHYKKPVVFGNTSTIRYIILECFMCVRADGSYHLGYKDDDKDSELKYSPYLLVDHKTGEVPASKAPPMSPAPTPYPQCVTTVLSLTQACQAIVFALREEKNWKVLKLLLDSLPDVMQNKALTLSRHGNDIHYLADALCALILDKSMRLPESLQDTPPNFFKSDFQNHVFPALASLVSYHHLLEPELQTRLVMCLQAGLSSKSAVICISALMLCALEMGNTMHKCMPQILLSLSKISATIHIAIPVLEFLSTLIRLPHVYKSFVEDQYMTIFAIALPYTNPFKFGLYTVSLAHHVTAIWFLKCQLPSRKTFVRYIKKGLESNISEVKPPAAEAPTQQAPCSPQKVVQPLAHADKDEGPHRPRSSSLHERVSSRKSKPDQGRPLSGQHSLEGGIMGRPQVDEKMLHFHKELLQTTLDLMARYTFASPSAIPKRFSAVLTHTVTLLSAAVEALLQNGCSDTWLLTNQLVTITTSSCRGKPWRNQLCDKCHILCSKNQLPLTSFPLEEENGRDGEGKRRRHQSEYFSASKRSSIPTVKDDLALSSSPSHAPFLRASLEESTGKVGNCCTCWCQGWAEIVIRRPTGVTSWVMRLQNSYENNLLALFPKKEGIQLLKTHVHHERSSEEEDEQMDMESDRNGGEPHSPVRRVQSSPGSKPKHLHVRRLDWNKSPESIAPRPILEGASGHRDRSATVGGLPQALSTQKRDNAASALTPRFLFLQLYYGGHFGTDACRPLPLPKTPMMERSLNVLDRITPYETYKIGVVYVGPGQADKEAQILGNPHGSVRYVEFLEGLGDVIDLTQVNKQQTFLGGLETNGSDGKYGITWKDEVMQVIFHVATLMPTRESDLEGNGKKLHIGNDHVLIVYNESGLPYNMSTIKVLSLGQFIFACVEIEPLAHETNVVRVRAKPELQQLLVHSEPKAISNASLSTLVRQMALHVNLGAMVLQSIESGHGKGPYASNWLERLRSLQRLRGKIEGSALVASTSCLPAAVDFTEFRLLPSCFGTIRCLHDLGILLAHLPSQVTVLLVCLLQSMVEAFSPVFGIFKFTLPLGKFFLETLDRARKMPQDIDMFRLSLFLGFESGLSGSPLVRRCKGMILGQVFWCGPVIFIFLFVLRLIVQRAVDEPIIHHRVRTGATMHTLTA
ncbi:unnamed protein product, partial [Darwinula stevensoni]